MKGTGNNLGTILRKLYFMLLPKCGMRSRYIKKHEHMFKHIGYGLMWQPRSFPSDPELISIGDNVMIAANVSFVNHDICSAMLRRKYSVTKNIIPDLQGCIKIGNNVMIGANTMILPNVNIGDNCIIGGGEYCHKRYTIEFCGSRYSMQSSW